jgi:hypothetical protein
MRNKSKPPPGRTGRGHRTECDPQDHEANNTAPAAREQSNASETPWVSFWPGREPFKASNLKMILEDEVLKRQTMPVDLNAMARALNDIHGAFWFRKTTTPKSRAKHVRAERVRDAIEVLTSFFEERRRAYRSKDGTASSKIIKSERQLYQQFHCFVLAMEAHDFRLDMDVDEAALMPRLDRWRHIAVAVATVFTTAMIPQEFGRSNEGPVARFVAAVMPLMTGERPAVSAVAQQLKRRARQKFSTGTT